MRHYKWLQRMIGFMLTTLLLDACSFSFQVLSTPIAPPAPPVEVSPAATQTLEPPTAIPPITTPTLLPIDVGTISMLQIFNKFQVEDIVRSLAFTPDGTVLAAAVGNDKDFAVHLWNTRNGEALGTLNGHTDIVWDAAFSPNGEMLASVSSDKTAKVWDWRNQTLLKSLDFPGEVVSVAFSPDGQSLAVGGVDGSQAQNAAIWTYSVSTWEPLMKFPEQINVNAMVFSPNGGTLVGGGTSRNVEVWRTNNSTPVFTLNHAHQVSRIAISPDSSTAATATCGTLVYPNCTEGAVWLWDLLTGKLKQTLDGFPNFVETVAFTPDGSSLIAASRDGTLRFYTTSNYQPLGGYASPGGVEALAISPDGRLLATGNDSGEIYLWKVVYHP